MVNFDDVKVGIVTSQFNTIVTQELKSGAVARLSAHGLVSDQIKCIDVPGAVEIPLVAKMFAKKKSVDAIICLGAVIRGETSHYDYVCEQVSQGCQRVMFDYEVPVIFGVLTTENFAQAMDRVGGEHGHKGVDCADVALEMIQVMHAFNTQSLCDEAVTA